MKEHKINYTMLLVNTCISDKIIIDVITSQLYSFDHKRLLSTNIELRNC